MHQTLYNSSRLGNCPHPCACPCLRPTCRHIFGTFSLAFVYISVIDWVKVKVTGAKISSALWPGRFIIGVQINLQNVWFIYQGYTGHGQGHRSKKSVRISAVDLSSPTRLISPILYDYLTILHCSAFLRGGGGSRAVSLGSDEHPAKRQMCSERNNLMSFIRDYMQTHFRYFIEQLFIRLVLFFFVSVLSLYLLIPMSSVRL